MSLGVAVVGAAGFFGSALCEVLEQNGMSVTRVTRATYAADRQRDYDVVVNTAMPAKRFWAKQHPELDRIETVEKTADLLSGWTFTRFVHVSTLSVRTEPDTIYGRHKAEAEALCRRPDCLVVRLTALYGPGMTKGSIIDIKNGGPVYVDGASRYAFTHVFFAAGWVAATIADGSKLTGIVEVGAKNSIALADIARHLQKDIEFSGPVEVQEVQHPAPGSPDAREVLSFVATLP